VPEDGPLVTVALVGRHAGCDVVVDGTHAIDVDARVVERLHHHVGERVGVRDRR
jgi:hypothetical protein